MVKEIRKRSRQNKQYRQNNRKKWYGMILLAVMLGCTVTACQKTPDQAPVVNKSEGLPKGCIIDKVKDGELKQIDAPEHWKETMERMDGRVTVEADVDIPRLSVSNTPVLELKKANFDNEQLKKLTDYFFKGRKFYQKPQMTKEELSHQITNIENKSGIYGEGTFLMLSKMEWKPRLEELMEKAPDKKQEKIYRKPEFSKPVQSEMEYMWWGTEDEMVRTENNCFWAVVETGEKVDPIIKAFSLNEKAGTAGYFSYSIGDVYDEEFLNSDKEDCIWDRKNRYPQGSKHLDDKEDFIQRCESAMENPAIAIDDAVETGNKILKDLGITGLSLEQCKKAVWFPNPPIWGHGYEDYALDLGENKAAYTLLYSWNLDGISEYRPIRGTLHNDMPELTYNPPFQPEKIEITVTEDGVVGFSWINMAELYQVVAENTKLLPFDKIKDRLAEHLQYIGLPPDGAGGADKDQTVVTFKVKSAELKAAYSTAFNAPDHVWLIPVWVFVVQSSYEGSEMYTMPETVFLNGIDGGFVNPS
ncbi:DUF6034 family protein [Robinsoniella peoriensis]|uniref:DUF6034 family protein n=1 Tax=Robinsoniella peoriensis TaxID=180332 RepID=UPI003752BCA5